MRRLAAVCLLFVLAGMVQVLDAGATEPAFVAINGSAFSPEKITVTAGTEVVWKNNEAAPHTVAADDGSFDSGTINQGDVFKRKFEKPGNYTYSCGNHAWMTGVVEVR